MSPSQVTIDILSNAKYAGAISSVSFITDWLNTGFGMALTLIAFLIILTAMLKNVLAGAYCAYPKFWDKVDAAHKEVESVSWADQLKGTFSASMNNGSLTTAMFRVLPNIKNLTDFEGDTVQPKAYFIRAIPQMIMCMIIGAFLYNGHYAKTASKVLDFGSTMLDRVLLEVDPVAVFDQFTGAAGRPEFSSDGSNDPYTQLVNRLASDTYTTVIGTYNDIDSAEAKRALATAIETQAYAFLKEIDAFDTQYTSNTELWEPRIKVTLTTGEVDLTNINKKPSPDGLIMQFAYQFPATDLGFSSNKEVGVDNWVRIRLNFNKQVVKSGKRTVTDIALHLTVGQQTTYKFAPTAFLYVAQNMPETPCLIEGKEGTISITDNVLKIVPPSGVAIGKDTVVEIPSGITLSTQRDTRKHKIATIVFDGKSGLTSASEEAYGNGSFDFNVQNLGTSDAVETTPSPSPSPAP